VPVLSQQPLQLAELQPASAVPPWQVPRALQTAPPLQAWQVAPLAPHAPLADGPTPGFWQLPLRSQQPWQLVELQPPPLPASQLPFGSQINPEAQAWQVPPLLPHALLEVPSWHVLVLSQQPLQFDAKHCALEPQDGTTAIMSPSAKPTMHQRNMLYSLRLPPVGVGVLAEGPSRRQIGSRDDRVSWPAERVGPGG
jgi:hypothetical protein